MKIRDICRLMHQIIDKTLDEDLTPGLRRLAIVSRARLVLNELEPAEQERHRMNDETVEKIREELERLDTIANDRDLWSWDKVQKFVGKLQALLPLTPEPEVPPGPYAAEWSASHGCWVVRDAKGVTIASAHPSACYDRPTALLLASSWQLRRNLEAAEKLLRGMRLQLARPGLGGTSTRTLIAQIDRHFQETGT